MWPASCVLFFAIVLNRHPLLFLFLTRKKKKMFLRGCICSFCLRKEMIFCYSFYEPAQRCKLRQVQGSANVFTAYKYDRYHEPEKQVLAGVQRILVEERVIEA